MLLLALLAVTAWGVVSNRKSHIGLAEYRTAIAVLVEETPYLIAAGPAFGAAMLKGAMPGDPPPAWFTALSDRVRSLLAR